MYYGNYIQTFIYFCSASLLVVLIADRPASRLLNRLHIGAVLCTVLVALGCLMGNVMGKLNARGSEEIYIDNLRFLSYLLVMVAPLFMLRLPSVYYVMIRAVYTALAKVYTVLVMLSLLLAGNLGDSIFPGNLFSTSTLNLTLVSGWSLYFLFQFLQDRKTLDLFFTVICWLVCVISLQKWNFFVILFIPAILVYYTVINSTKIAVSIKSILVALLLIPVFAGVLFSEQLLDRIAQQAGYKDIQTFLDDRVLRSNKDNVHIDRGIIDVGNDQGIKDGGRILMWIDLSQRTMEAPLTGVGFGYRALERVGFDMEDHNIFMAFFARFGIPLFLFNVLGGIFYYRSLHQCFADANPLYRNLLLLCYLNFFFQASVGNVWGQSFVTLLLGMAWGIMAKKRNGADY